MNTAAAFQDFDPTAANPTVADSGGPPAALHLELGDADAAPIVVRLAGELDTATVAMLRTVLTRPRAAGHRHVSVDVSELPFLGAGGVEELVLVDAGLRRIGGPAGADRAVHADAPPARPDRPQRCADRPRPLPADTAAHCGGLLREPWPGRSWATSTRCWWPAVRRARWNSTSCAAA